MSPRPLLKWLAIGSFVLMGLSRCTSSPPVQSPPPNKAPGVLEEVGKENNSAAVAGAPDNPLLTHITEKLQGLGYEALGLQFESDDTLLLIGKVFDSPIAQDRQIHIIYTGLEMSYDSKHKSLTVGGTKSLSAILSFIDKNIPKRENTTVTAGETGTQTVESSTTSTILNPEAPASTLISTPTIPNPSKKAGALPETRSGIKDQKKRAQMKKSKGKALGIKPQKKTILDAKKTAMPKASSTSTTTTTMTSPPTPITTSTTTLVPPPSPTIEPNVESNIEPNAEPESPSEPSSPSEL